MHVLGEALWGFLYYVFSFFKYDSTAITSEIALESKEPAAHFNVAGMDFSTPEWILDWKS